MASEPRLHHRRFISPLSQCWTEQRPPLAAVLSGRRMDTSVRRSRVLVAGISNVAAFRVDRPEGIGVSWGKDGKRGVMLHSRHRPSM